MSRRTIHFALELLVGIPSLLLGVFFVGTDIAVIVWIAADSENRRGFIGLGTAIGILPLLLGCWLTFSAFARRRSSGIKSPAPNSDNTS